jgi:hypothetical protein
MFGAHHISTVTAGMLGSVTFFLAAIFVWRFAVARRLRLKNRTRLEAIFGLFIVVLSEALHNLFILLARTNLIGWQMGDVFDPLTATARAFEILGCVITCRALTRARYGEKLWSGLAVAAALVGALLFFHLQN